AWPRPRSWRSAARAATPPDARSCTKRTRWSPGPPRGTNGAARSSSLTGLAAALDLRDLGAELGHVLRLRVEIDGGLVELQRALHVAAFGQHVAEVLVHRRVARQEARGVGQILLGEVELP